MNQTIHFYIGIEIEHLVVYIVPNFDMGLVDMDCILVVVVVVAVVADNMVEGFVEVMLGELVVLFEHHRIDQCNVVDNNNRIGFDQSYSMNHRYRMDLDYMDCMVVMAVLVVVADSMMDVLVQLLVVVVGVLVSVFVHCSMDLCIVVNIRNSIDFRMEHLVPNFDMGLVGMVDVLLVVLVLFVLVWVVYLVLLITHHSIDQYNLVDIGIHIHHLS